ncbi:hypothetical protein [Arsenicicoccus dermatophilus]|uniref:hypothetical protein n=1 Tax=Arsenicicoccus dermatophilus TaxID=1076331 RepID=UPI001F4CB34B|nr:hypothetical protein [Arsenicicoccus dermatophilus]MCH8613470.1 hypothetical protein [Arsenicicoccus dermatophilus]
MSGYTITDVRAALEARLKATAPTVNVLRSPTDVAPTDPDRRVHPYVVLYLSAGVEDERSQDLAGHRDLDHLDLQVTCVGGDQERCEHAITRARAVLTGWAPLPGAGPFRGVPGGTPIAKDITFDPPRWYAPLLLTVQLP